MPSKPQVIEGQYLDQQKLIRLLKSVYGISDEGKNKFRVEVRYPSLFSLPKADHSRLQLRLNRYKIYPLEDTTARLTEARHPLCLPEAWSADFA